MFCSCCSCYYCSACAPQPAGTDDRLWEDILSTLGSALRDVERIKDTVSVEISNVSVDLDRFRSAFNCQSPGNETLSAEQIVVEHAFEQAKSVMSCGAPTDLDSQEEVIAQRYGGPGADDASRAGGYGAISEDSAPPRAPHEAPMMEEPTPQAPTDLLDLSASTPMEVTRPGSGSPMGLMSLSPVKAAAAEPMVIASLPEKAPTDLLDLSLHDEADEPLVSLSSAKAAHPVAPDLLDLSFQPEAAAIAGHQPTNLQDIVDVKVEPAQSPAVHDLADLLDFGEQPKVQTAA